MPTLKPNIDQMIGKAIATQYFNAAQEITGQPYLEFASVQRATLVALVAFGIREYKSAVARALRSIPSAKRASASRANGKRGGRPRTRT